MINKVFLRGYVGANPEQFGTITKFRLATDENWQDSNGTWQKKTEWHNCVAFGQTAERVFAKIRKGDIVAIDDGKIQTRQYDRKDGQKVYATSIVVNKFEVLNKPKRQEQMPLDELDQELAEPPAFDPNELIPF